MQNSSFFVFTTVQELTCHRSQERNVGISLSVNCSPHIEQRTPTCSNKTWILCIISWQKTRKWEIKKPRDKEGGSKWKNKWWFSPPILEPGDMLHVISVSWYAVVRWWCAGQGQFTTESRALRWRQVKRSNCSLSPNKYMDEWISQWGERVQGSKRDNDSSAFNLWPVWHFSNMR